ncbi:MAG: lytic transglycosylase domain-containing protein [Bacteroidia bacterium]|nr:lytic transglycosylase domain-containing protein [Bacteroidia bacterium]
MKSYSTIKYKNIIIRCVTLIGAFFLFWSIFHLLNFTISNSGKQQTIIEEFRKFYNVYSVALPETLDFCGEQVPLEYFDVRESLDKELLVNIYWQSQTLLFLKRVPKYFPVIEPILKQNNIPDDFKYLAVIESGLMNVISPTGATGYWQFLKDTGIEYGLEITDEVDERYNLEKSTLAACDFLNKAFGKYNNWTMAAASYNTGMSSLDKQIEKQNERDYYNLVLNIETARYIYRILAVKLILEAPEKYGFHIHENDKYYQIPFYEIQVDSSVTDLVQFAAYYNTNYKILKLLNPWLRNKILTNNDKKIYTIKLPEQNARSFRPSVPVQKTSKDSSLRSE